MSAGPLSYLWKLSRYEVLIIKWNVWTKWLWRRMRYRKDSEMVTVVTEYRDRLLECLIRFPLDVTLTACGRFFVDWFSNDMPIDWDNMDVVE